MIIQLKKIRLELCNLKTLPRMAVIVGAFEFLGRVEWKGLEKGVLVAKTIVPQPVESYVETVSLGHGWKI